MLCRSSRCSDDVKRCTVIAKHQPNCSPGIAGPESEPPLARITDKCIEYGVRIGSAPCATQHRVLGVIADPLGSPALGIKLSVYHSPEQFPVTRSVRVVALPPEGT